VKPAPQAAELIVKQNGTPILLPKSNLCLGSIKSKVALEKFTQMMWGGIGGGREVGFCFQLRSGQPVGQASQTSQTNRHRPLR
jgi:hypothetical protein